MLNRQKGFTIIELIVVIAIIAVLAGVILVSVMQFINKAKDAGIKASLGLMGAAGEVVFESTGSYGGLCNSFVKKINYNVNFACTDPLINIALGIIKQTGNKSKNDLSYDGAKWSACANLFSEAGGWCVDYNGNRKYLPNGCLGQVGNLNCP